MLKGPLERIQKLSKLEKGATSLRFCKLTEEVGEFSAAYLVEEGYKVDKFDLTDAQKRDHILEEGVDSAIMIFDILFEKGFTNEEIAEKFGLKLDVWEGVIEKKRLKAEKAE